MPIPMAKWEKDDLAGHESYTAHHNGCRMRIWQLSAWHWSAVYIGDPAADVADDAITGMGYGIAEDSAAATIAAELWADSYRPEVGA